MAEQRGELLQGRLDLASRQAVPGSVVIADFELPGLQFQDPLQILGVFAGLPDARPTPRIAPDDLHRLGRAKAAILLSEP